MFKGGYHIQRIPIHTATWTAFLPAYPCTAWSIRCDSDGVKLRSDPDDAGTEDSLALGTTEYVLGSQVTYEVGRAIVHLKAQTLDGAVVIAKLVRW